MRKIKIIILTLLLVSKVTAQDWAQQIRSQAKLIGNIINNDEWKDIYKIAKNDLKLSNQDLKDIKETIKFVENNERVSRLDLFFLDICDTVYDRFPYKSSGYLSNGLYEIPIPDTTQNVIKVRGTNGKELYSKYAEIINIDENILIPQLLKYLDNNSATRLCIRQVEWDESPFYLSISDIAMELIEVKTYCDFFDNAAHSAKLFSNLSELEKEKVIEDVEKWMKFKDSKTQFQKIEYFLDSISDLGHSYRYTCHNLLFSGDTIGASKMYIKFYEQTEMPCSQDFNVGKILLELGDRRMLYDCSNKIYNYKCIPDAWESLGRNCVEVFFNSDEAWFRDDVFAEIVATEPYSNYRNSDRSKFIWHFIFGMIPNTDKKLLKTLVELMSRKETTNSLNNKFTDGWKTNYPNEFDSSYRVCDFALLKYLESIKKETKLICGSIEEKKKLNQILHEIDALDMDNIDNRDKMIEIIKKYED